jgi:Domain of unknown function (DUF1942)
VAHIARARRLGAESSCSDVAAWIKPIIEAFCRNRHRALFQVPTQQGVIPSSLVEGEKTSGKVYFDVTGDATDSVVYNAGGDDLLVWTQPQASALRSPRSADGRFFPAQTGTSSGCGVIAAPR